MPTARRIISGWIFIVAVAVLAIAVMGCARNKKVDDKAAVTVAAINAKVVADIDGARRACDGLDASNPTQKQKVLIGDVRTHVNGIEVGNADMKTVADAAVEANSDVRRKRDEKLNKNIFSGIIIFSAGIAAMFLGSKWPMASVIGGAVAVFGAALGVISFAFQIADPWVRFAVAALTIFSVGFFIFRTIRKDFELRKKSKQIQAKDVELKKQDKATDELVQRIDHVKPYLPAQLRADLKDVSPDTAQLVKESREKTEAALHPAPAETGDKFTGLALGVTTGKVNGTVAASEP